MIIGICKVKLRIPENTSLKGKRRIVKSIITKVKNKYNVSVAEVSDQQLWQIATLGVCSVSNNSRHANEVISKVVNFITNGRFEVEVLDSEVEIIPC
jgi:uncharacterized protein YlxP (DUF503 family)